MSAHDEAESYSDDRQKNDAVKATTNNAGEAIISTYQNISEPPLPRITPPY